MRKKISRSKGAAQTQQRLTPASLEAAGGAAKQKRGRHAHAPFTAEELRKISGEISGRELPEPGATRLELLEIDPWNVHAYWHIKASDMASCRARLADKGRNARLVLRFTDVSPKQDSNGLHEKFDIEVTEDSNNWYVNLWRDAKHYSGEIGLRAADGAFEALVRSNEVATPRAGPSHDVDFFLVDARIPSWPEPAAAIMPRALNEDLLRNLFPQRVPSRDEFPLVVQDTLSSPLDEPAFPALGESGEEAALYHQHQEGLAGAEERALGNAEVARSFPMLVQSELDDYARQTGKSKKEVMANGKLPPLESPSEGMVAPAGIELVSHSLPVPSPTVWPEEAVLLSQGERSVTTEGADSRPVTGKHPSGQDNVDDVGEKRVTYPIALEMLVGKTAFSPAAVDNTFDIAASLVVEGVCPTNSRLLLFGEPVHVEPDGTFSLKLPLECGPALVELLYRARGRLAKE